MWVRLLLLVSLWLAATAAYASSAEKEAQRRHEAAQLIEALKTGQVNAATAANRLKLWGQEGPASLELAHALAGQLDIGRRRDLTETLALLGHPVGASALERGLNDADGAVRKFSAQGLGKIANPRAAPRLLPLLNDPTSGVRREAARALGIFRQPRWSKPLIEAARREGETEVKVAMLEAAGLSGDKRQVPALLTFLKSSSEATRWSAGRALCLLGSSQGLAVAKAQLQSAQATERMQGVLLLEGTPARFGQGLLKPMLKDEDKAVAAAAARVLYQGGDASMLTWLVVEAFHAQGADQSKLESVLEGLRLSDEQRKKILVKAGLR